MSESSKSYRIRTTVGEDKFVSVNLEQDYDVFDILSLKISSADVYRLHNSNYGVIVGRVLANNGFGIPNAKISVFIESDENDSGEMLAIYPYKTTASRDENGVRYNLLPDEKVANCHQVIGTFPNKRFVLDNDDIIEVFDKYYKYTTRTNGAGDYIIVGVPTGNQTLHMDLDLSDCGILSQRPRDFVYKGYTIEQFENPNMFKTSTALDSLSQVFTQDQSVYVQPFWGNESLGETIGITRADIDVAFKFEPTCVFMGCIASDNASQGISKKCIPTPHMGDMDELTTGEGTIEMIRKTYAGSVEEFQVKGTELIDGNGIWCYQIPMNLDYMMTDEYGNMVPTDNPDKGIPTRTRVRFRISMQDMEANTDNYFRPKVLVPHNPQNLQGTSHEDYDYDFGTNTKDESFRDLFWNNVYTVKSYIPRFQKRKVAGWKEKKFTGIKHVQDYGRNNPMPYNNIRIRMPFMFKVMCILIKIFIKIVSVVNTIISMLGNFLSEIGRVRVPTGIKFKNWKIQINWWYPFKSLYEQALKLKMNVIDEGLCPDLENWYFSPMFKNNLWSPAKKIPDGMKRYDLLKQTLDSINNDDDPYSVDDQNQDDEDEAKCLTINTDYLISCIEMNLAQEYKVINFDFYNDWVNGLIYIPRFMRYIRKKRKFLGITIIREKVRGCMDDTKIFSKTRRYTQMCSLGYTKQTVNRHDTFSKVTTNLKSKRQIVKSNNFHKKRGLTQEKVFGKKNGGLVHESTTIHNQYVYYLKPCEWTPNTTPLNRKINLFATDLVLLGSLNDCDINGIPQAFKHLTSSSYIMPTNLALTNMEENGYLYAYGDNGTMCSKYNQTEEGTDVEKLSNPINRIESSKSNPLSNELNFYDTQSSNYDVQYDDPSDTMAITEAAGIAWNYTGPGQGEIDKKKLYYPGGHFLGLSCVNSQTNIKSCINLERICELGTAMSQRKEDVRAVKDVNGESVLEYVYSIPTGLISGDDIIDDEFRTMFATMNSRRLIATKLNPETGYFTYDFAYSNPVNFSGELIKYTGQNTPYNKDISVDDESTILQKYGIDLASTRPDYDQNEVYNTKARTIEFSSIDYYMFRLGLDYSEAKKSSSSHIRQFAKSDGGTMYLPQYENSFYFYFGMKDGSTALDEFNKQFFSQCENSVLSERDASAYIAVSDFDVCAGVSEVFPYVTNMEAPLLIKIKDADEVEVYRKRFEDEDDLEVIALERGEYIITIMDSEGNDISAKFSIGNGVLNGLFTSYDFNVSDQYLPRNSSNSNMYYGGYIEAEGISISGADVENLTIFAENGTRTEAQAPVDSEGNAKLYLSTPNIEYGLHVSYNCKGNSHTVYFDAGKFTLKNTASIYMTMGPVEKFNTDTLNYNAMYYDPIAKTGWWTGAYDEDSDEPTFRSWNIRKSLIRPYKPGYATFSNSVEAANGIKTVFMVPQGEDGFSFPFTSSDNYDSVPPGYSVDDDATYYPTFAVVDGDDPFQINSWAYDGYVVGGDFCATVTNQPGAMKSINIVRDGWKLRTMEGVLFKPLPDGEIISARYMGNGVIECYCSADEYTAATNGVVYPTIVYPVIDKQFSVNANVFEITSRYFGEDVNDDGESVIVPEIGVIGGKCEASIKNGVTFKRHFGGESYMTYIFNNQDDIDEGKTEIEVMQNDMYGAIPGSEEPRILYFSGYSMSAAEDVNYSIIEGYPLFADNGLTSFSAFKDGSHQKYYSGSSRYAAVAESADLSMDAHFYEKVYYRKPSNGNIITLIQTGSTDKSIKYYLLPITSNYSDNIYIRTGKTVDDYIVGDKHENAVFGGRAYVLAEYTSKAEYDIEGKEVVVELKDVIAWGKVRATIPFTHENEDSTEVVYETEKLDVRMIKDNGLDDCLNSVVDKFGGRVRFRKKRCINYFDGFTEQFGKSWTKKILSACTEANEIKDMSIDGVNTSDFVIVGVKNFVDPYGMANGNRCMVYLYPIEAKEPFGSEATSINGGTQSVGSGATTIRADIILIPNTHYTAVSNNDWITITGGGSNTNSTTETISYPITLSILANDGYERVGSVTIRTRENGTDKEFAEKTINITQAEKHVEQTTTP